MIFFFSHWSGFWWVWRKRIWVARSFWAHFIYRMYLGRRSYQRLCTIWFWLCYWFLLFVCLLGSFANFLLQINVTYNNYFSILLLGIYILKVDHIIHKIRNAYPKNSRVKKHHKHAWYEKRTQRGVDDVFRIIKCTYEIIFCGWYGWRSLMLKIVSCCWIHQL